MKLVVKKIIAVLLISSLVFGCAPEANDDTAQGADAINPLDWLMIPYCWIVGGLGGFVGGSFVGIVVGELGALLEAEGEAKVNSANTKQIAPPAYQMLVSADPTADGVWTALNEDARVKLEGYMGIINEVRRDTPALDKNMSPADVSAKLQAYLVESFGRHQSALGDITYEEFVASYRIAVGGVHPELPAADTFASADDLLKLRSAIAKYLDLQGLSDVSAEAIARPMYIRDAAHFQEYAEAINPHDPTAMTRFQQRMKNNSWLSRWFARDTTDVDAPRSGAGRSVLARLAATWVVRQLLALPRIAHRVLSSIINAIYYSMTLLARGIYHLLVQLNIKDASIATVHFATNTAWHRSTAFPAIITGAGAAASGVGLCGYATGASSASPLAEDGLFETNSFCEGTVVDPVTSRLYLYRVDLTLPTPSDDALVFIQTIDPRVTTSWEDPDAVGTLDAPVTVHPELQISNWGPDIDPNVRSGWTVSMPDPENSQTFWTNPYYGECESNPDLADSDPVKCRHSGHLLELTRNADVQGDAHFTLRHVYDDGVLSFDHKVEMPCVYLGRGDLPDENPEHGE